MPRNSIVALPLQSFQNLFQFAFVAKIAMLALCIVLFLELVRYGTHLIRALAQVLLRVGKQLVGTEATEIVLADATIGEVLDDEIGTVAVSVDAHQFVQLLGQNVRHDGGDLVGFCVLCFVHFG